MIVYLLLLIVVVFILFYRSRSEKETFSNSLLNFDYKVASFEYPKIVAIFGSPHVLKDEPNGFIMWRKPGIFENIYIMDEAVKHDTHCDFLYATIKIHIPEFAMEKVNNLSKSIIYDRLKQEMTVRCNSLSAIVRVMASAMEIIHNKIQTENSDKYIFLKNMIEENHIQYADKLNIKSCVFSQGTTPSLFR